MASTNYSAIDGRKFGYYIPDSYDASKPTPVLYMFHGLGGNSSTTSGGSAERNYYGWQDTAEKNGFIVIFPEAQGYFKAWSLASGGRSSDLGYVEDLLLWVDENYNISKSQVFATGHSWGAYFSYYVAVHLVDKIAAFAAHSGGNIDTWLGATPSAPIISEGSSVLNGIILHAKNDEIVPYASSQSLYDDLLINGHNVYQDGAGNDGIIEVDGWGPQNHRWRLGNNQEQWDFFISVAPSQYADADNDGFVDSWDTYRLTDGNTSIQLRNKKRKVYSDESSKSWDAVKAVQSGDGWKVLLDGASSKEGKFKSWDVNASGVITKGSGWKTTDQALDAGWEAIFGDLIHTDGITGTPATDTDSDGLVDSWGTYRLTDGSSSIQLRNKKGTTYSDDSNSRLRTSRAWDAVKAVQSGDGWKVLLDGASKYEGKFKTWDVNASGVITKASGWKSTDQALDAGWESTFGDLINVDGITGISATDTDSDGLVDGWSTYRLTDGSTSLQLRNRRGTTYSDASSRSWDAVKAVQSGDGWKVLLEGASKLEGKFRSWDVNSSGLITKASGWKTADQSLEAGWEELFGVDINNNGSNAFPS